MSDDDPGLRAAEELVTRERDEVRAGAEALGRRRLVADRGERARAEIVHEREAGSLGNRGELGESRLLREADHAEVRLVHAEQQRRFRADRRLVVGRPRAIRRPDLDEPRTRPGEHFRDPEAVPDLDQLAARDHDLAAFRERREREQHRGSVVVHDERGVGARQPLEERREVLLPRAALPALDVVLEVRVAGADLRDACERGLRERRTAEVRVHEHARRVQHAPQRRTARSGDLLEHRLLERGRLASGANLGPRPVEHRPRGGQGELVREVDEPLARRAAGRPRGGREASACPQCRPPRSYAARTGRSSRRSAVSRGCASAPTWRTSS